MPTLFFFLPLSGPRRMKSITFFSCDNSHPPPRLRQPGFTIAPAKGKALAQRHVTPFQLPPTRRSARRLFFKKKTLAYRNSPPPWSPSLHSSYTLVYYTMRTATRKRNKSAWAQTSAKFSKGSFDRDLLFFLLFWLIRFFLLLLLLVLRSLRFSLFLFLFSKTRFFCLHWFAISLDGKENRNHQASLSSENRKANPYLEQNDCPKRRYQSYPILRPRPIR